MKISIIAAVADNGVIGRSNGLVWHLPVDLKRFKQLTVDQHLIMGRKTFESVGVLPRRQAVVITRQLAYRADRALVFHSLSDALAYCRLEALDEVFIGGGAEIYRQALPLADRMYLTHVHARPEGDTCFPEFDCSEWAVVDEVFVAQDERHAYSFTFVDYLRRS